MFYVIIRSELSSHEYDSLDFSHFKKFKTYEEAVAYGESVCDVLSEYQCCGYEILKTYENEN